MATEQRAKNDPVRNFDSLWTQVRDNYAFFATRGVDWDALYDTYRAQVSSRSTPAQLEVVARRMLRELADDHVTLRGRSTSGSPEADLEGIALDVARRYVPRLSSSSDGNVRWGAIDEDIGYIQLNSMEDDVEKRLPAAVRAMQGKRAVIFDLRFNEGGYDETARLIMSHFTAREHLVYTRQTKSAPTRANPTGLSRPASATITPAADRFLGKVFMLTSPSTASAAEIAAIATIPQGHTRIGARTNGILSDMNEFKLPNGWSFTLSNEIYRAADGVIYEHVGVPPHHEIDYSRDQRVFVRQLRATLPAHDPAIEKALSLARQVR